MSDRERWGIIGGGMLGMTIAMRLAQRGCEVTILEGADELGGLAATWQLDDVVWDKHYHVILLSDAYLRGVLGELDIDDEIEWVETRTGVYADGKLHSVSSPLEFLKFPPLNLVDKARLAWTILYASRIQNWRKLEQIPVEDWLVRHSGRRTFARFWKPLLRSKLGDNYRIASASFIWASIQRLYAARRSGLKREMFGYVRGGYARILSRFAEHLNDIGVKARLGARVAHVARRAGGIHVQLADETVVFDKVVVTPAAPIAARLIEGLTGEEQRRLEGVTYQGIVCASVLMDKPLADFYVTNITETVPFTGVIEMTALVDPATFGGRSLVYLPKYTTGREEILEWSDQRIKNEFTAGLEEMYPQFDRSQVRAFEVSRVQYVLPLATLGYSERVPRFATSVPGVFTVNSSQILNGTLNVNETVQLAERAIAVLADGARDSLASLEAHVTPGGVPVAGVR